METFLEIKNQIGLTYYLEYKRSVLEDWESPKTKDYNLHIILAKEYDELIYGMSDILKKILGLCLTFFLLNRHLLEM